MKLGKLHVSIMWTGAALMWLEPSLRGTWHAVICWWNPAFQCGHIGKRGFGGLLCQPHKAPNGKRAWFVGAWAMPSQGRA